MTFRLLYRPSPNPSWRLPSRAIAMAQTFSVQARSDDPVTANVSTIWWPRPSSSGVRGPMGVSMSGAPCREVEGGPTGEQVLEESPVGDEVLGIGGLRLLAPERRS